MVVVRLSVRLGEDDLLGERAHVLVLTERLPRLAQRLAPDRESRGSEQGGGEVLADVRGELGIHRTRDDPAAEDYVRGLEVAHDDDGHRCVVQVHLGNVLRAVPVRDHQRLGLVPHPLLRERPGLPDNADKWEALLDDDRAARAVADDVNKVDVTVAHLLRRPRGAALRAAERRGHLGLGGAVVQHGVAVERDKAGRSRKFGRRRVGPGDLGDKLAHREIPRRRLAHHPLLGDDPGDERGGGDVERRVPDVDALGGDPLPEAVGDFRRGSILDDDIRTLRRGRVQGADGRRHEERHVMVRGGDGQVVGADLVRGVAVIRDAIGADDDGVNLPLGHERRRGGVADEGAGHLLEGDLVRGEPRALVVGPGLVAVDVLQAVGLPQSADDSERGAESRGCEGSGVAVGEDPDGGARGFSHRRAQGIGAERADGAVVGDVGGEHPLALGDDRLDGVRAGSVEGRRELLDALDRLSEVDRGGSAGVEVVHLRRDERAHVTRGRERRLGAVELHRQREGCGDRDRGCAADVHVLDGGPAHVAVGNVHEDRLGGQLQLIEQLQLAAGVADSLERRSGHDQLRA